MELLVESKKAYNVTDEGSFRDEKILSRIGRDFNKSVANINGLISLLDDLNTSDPDFKKIQHYLSSEALKLQVMVKDICR